MQASAVADDETTGISVSLSRCIVGWLVSPAVFR